MLYEPVGCPVCSNTGFNGRQGIFEAIKMDEAVEEAVIRDPREHIILEAAEAQGIPTMTEDGIEKVLQGVTSLAELRRVVDISIARTGPVTPTDAVAQKSAAESDEFTAHIVWFCS